MLMNFTITHCLVASVRADLLKGRVKITFEATLDEEMLDAKRKLALLAMEEAPVDLTVVERSQQLRMVAVSPVEVDAATGEILE